MNFIVFGAGAIGSYVGGRLAAAGEKVTLVGRPRIVDAIAAQGLLVTDLDGFNAQVQPGSMRAVSALEQVTPLPDCVVLLCVKGGSTEVAAQALGARFAPGTPLLSLQNGVDNMDRITRKAPHLAAMAGMVPYNVVMPTTTQVHRASSGNLHIGHSTWSQRVASVFIAAGLDAIECNDMKSVQWGKLLLNLNNPVNALSDLPLRDQLMQRDYRMVLAALQTETLATLRSFGIRPAKVSSAPPTLLPHILRLPDWLFAKVAARMLRIDPSARSSMWDDLQQRRVTEIDDLCGAVVRLAGRTGGVAALNAAMCALVQAHRPGERMSAAQMRHALKV